MRRRLHSVVSRFSLLGLIITCTSTSLVAQDSLARLRTIERGGKGLEGAQQIAQQIQSGKELSLEQVLQAASGANPVAKNWLLAVAQSVLTKSNQPTQLLESVLADQKGDPEVRYWALDRLAGNDESVREKLLEGRIEDSSLDIRYEAIALVKKSLDERIEKAKSDPTEAAKVVTAYKQILNAARLPEQVNAIADKLKDLESPVDVRQLFGFVSKWQVVAPFDNHSGVGFPIPYPPESEYLRVGKLDVATKYPGKTKEVAWTAATTDKPDGAVDLNPIFEKEKGAVAYAYAEVISDKDVECEVRLGCINANKVWVNGQEAFANEVYHTGAQIDQYVGSAKLTKGTNTVLIKICQNEQTESWAQDWAFQLRFSDATGKAIAVSQK